MAEKRFLKGLFKDTAHIDQPKETWRHARNAILNQTKGAISNEGGTEEAGTFHVPGIPIDVDVIGIVEVEDDKAVFFIYDNTNTYSEIGLWESGIYKRVYFDTLLANIPGNTLGQRGLEFSTRYPIEGTYNINPKGELIVYWTDDNNPPRALNITLQQSTSDPASGGTTSQIYGIDSTSSHKNHIDLLNLFPHAGPVPHIRVLDKLGPGGYPKIGSNQTQLATKEGGGLLTGVYYLSLAYVDDSYTATNFLTMSNPISIVEEGDHTKPNTKKDGAKSGTQTSKSITWDVTNLNTDYKFIRPVIIRKMGEAVDAYRLNDLEIVVSTSPTLPTTPNTTPHRPGMSITFSGIEGFTPTSLEDVIIDTVSYETVKTLNQLDGVLYVGNTTSVEDLGYQKYANNIKLNAVTRTFGHPPGAWSEEQFDPVILSVDNLETGFSTQPVDSMGSVVPSIQNTGHEASYRYTPKIYEKKGYMRDEVYAFYIAFILNDGSMSYAYHIPGRESTGDDLLSLENEGWFKSFIKLSPEYMKRFHLHDYSDLSGNRNMNYWENATELYPNTENFEVWDGNINTGSIQGTPVRHHHFPSNGNPTHKTIHQNKSSVSVSDGTQLTAKNWSSIMCPGSGGSPCATTSPSFTAYIPQTFRIGYYGSPQANFNIGCNSWHTMRWPNNSNYEHLPVGSPPDWTGQQMRDALWHNGGGYGKYFVADQPMEVRAALQTYICNLTSSGSGADTNWGTIQIVKETAGGVITVEGSEGWCTGGNGSTCSSTGCILSAVDWTNPIALDVGDKIYARIKSVGNKCSNLVRYHEGSTLTKYNFITFAVNPAQNMIEPDDLHDVRLAHKVKILGFELEDVKIPLTMSKKIQGFRIYRAKRKHEDKRILGQSILTPMLQTSTTLGRCEETAGNVDSFQIMASELSLRELVYTKDPWTLSYYNYPQVPMTHRYNDSLDLWQTRIDPNVYKSFSFNDFNLLRTQNSIAGATHIKPEYFVRNFVWNGPTLNQKRKMMSKIIEDDGDGTYSEPIKKIEQFWGWDTAFNCYHKEIRSAIFVGCHYRPVNSLINGPEAWNDPNSNDIRGEVAAPRRIGQKAKTYIPGDSIFQAAALGFGGKIANEFGESSLIFSLEDSHEFYTSHIISNTHSTTAVSGLSTDDFSAYGVRHLGAPPILVNPLLNSIPAYNTYPHGHPNLENNRRSQTLMANLHAFKTDVYKSIDNQELVWTGFEILGDDLNNFICADGTGPLPGYLVESWNTSVFPMTVNTNLNGPDFKTSTVQNNPRSVHWEQQYSNISNTPNYNPDWSNHGIFGGDTFICRYGFRSTLQHNSTEESSSPLRSIHYHIVESPDNINFRHTESENDLYFPGSIAKRMLHLEGDKDLTHQDNLKYDDSFSAENDLRPAFPLPLKIIEQTDFPTRAHRSVKRDTTSLTDNYRIFLANEFKDLPKNRGELWKLSTLNNLLYFHMEESLYVTKGKQQMQMKDGTEAFVGSGDIFAQEPDEIMQADKGYGGTQSQWAALTCNYGYFFVDINSRKVFLMKDKLTEVSSAGLEEWFKTNLPFELEEYGLRTNCLDNPIISLGLTAIYDPKFKRILLTKKDLRPTQSFIDGINANVTTPGPCDNYPDDLIRFNSNNCIFEQWGPLKGGGCGWTDIPFICDTNNFTCNSWTISYYPEFNVWCGFHDYTPYTYFNTSDNFYSIMSDNTEGLSFKASTIWEHNSNIKGSFYGTIWPFEIEYIQNEYREEDTLLGSFNYTLETFNQQTIGLEIENISVLEQGFTSFFVYNTLQISDEIILEYLINIRRVGNNWKINNFRDMAAIAVNTNPYYMSTNTNIIGGTNTGTITTSSTVPMFTIDGPSKLINPLYINTAKEWQDRRKFIDKWAGIRLIYDNISNNLLNLYSAAAAVRKTYK